MLWRRRESGFPALLKPQNLLVSGPARIARSAHRHFGHVLPTRMFYCRVLLIND